MSRYLPAISGGELVKALRRSGFVVLRQKGSHVSLERRTVAGYWRTIVPLHREIRPEPCASSVTFYVLLSQRDGNCRLRNERPAVLPSRACSQRRGRDELLSK